MSVELISIKSKEDGDKNANGDVEVDTGNGVNTEQYSIPQTNGSVPHDDGDSNQDGGDLTKVPETEVKVVGVFEMFKFATPLDKALMIIGSIAGLIQGASLPLLFVIFGQVANTFVQGEKLDSFLKYYNVEDQRNLSLANDTYFRNLIESLNASKCYSVENLRPPELTTEMGSFVFYYCGLALFVILCAYLSNTFWSMAAERQTRRMREEFFRAVMKQEIGWFDQTEAGALNSRLVDDIAKIHDGIGEKSGMFFEYISRAFSGLLVAFIFGWELALVVLSLSPAMMIAVALMGKIMRKMTIEELTAYSKAGSIAEEVLSSIRTVMAFGGEHKECHRYGENLVFAKKAGIKKGLTQGLLMGFFNLVMFSQYSLGFWYGARLTYTQCENYTAGTMFTVFTCILIAAMSLGNAAPSFADFATARGAAYEVFKIIGRTSSIDSSSKEGQKLEKVVGNIEFKNILFAYPSRPDVQVMRDFSLKVDQGSTVALVGPSGCGKSTTVQLLQRFYDPLGGEVKIDGVNIRDLNIQWLRQNIGIVSQEPILFETTIEENIRFGQPDMGLEQIIEAAKKANAHDFVSQLPQKYKTLVGERGAHLSGGQKQRIAIARALVRDPKILLLDEATSALDTESEAVVQSALDKARMGRTTIVIAHRLSTVRTADLIVGIENGGVKEHGTHSQLMAKEGLYYQLVTSQTEGNHNEENVADDVVSIEEFKRALSQSSRAQSPNESLTRKRSSIKRVQSAISQKDEEEKEEVLEDPPFSRILKYNAKEWPYILVGCLSALGNGAIMPAFAVVYASVISVFVEADPAVKESTAQIVALCFLAVGVGGAIVAFLQIFLFTVSGERLTERLRTLAFKTILRQEISWFDDHRNSTGTLTTRLATDASSIQGASGSRIATFLQNTTGMGVAIVIAFFFSWRLTLVSLGFVPMMAIAMFLRMNLMMRSAQKDKKAMEGAGKIFLEASVNIRTVASLSLEDYFIEEFNQYLGVPFKENMRKMHFWGFVYGFSQSVMFWSQAAIFSYGAYLVTLGFTDPDINIKFEDIMKVFSCIMFGAMGMGRASSFAADYGKCKAAAARLFQLFDRVPEIDNFSTEGDCPKDFTPSVEFKDVGFNYPTRPGVKVLRGLNVSVNPGETLALVGSSGCGKSTTIQLMERFYDPLSGQVIIDDMELRSLNLGWLRKQIGLVLQEPVLFDCSIRENIAYGDNSRDVTMDEIITAARDANIHSFIESLPLGYETRVGDKGTQLSGGQKQRVAIARALLRNPRILLLDEATSALDSESEKIVQEALDKARTGRTSIVIAHRLSTIQNADKIAVIFNGRVVEQGTHQSLMKLEGFYYSLQTVQQTD